MKKILMLCLFVSLLTNAQKFNITKGTEFTFEKSKWINLALDNDSAGFYYFRSIGGYFSTKYVIQKFDLKKATTVFEKHIDLSGDDYLGGKGFFQCVYNKNGKILVFSQATKGKKNHFMMQEFSSITGEELGKPVIIDELEDTKAYIISEAVLEFNVNFSPDNKKMLVVAEIKKDNTVQRVLAKLYDVNGYKKIWEKEPIGTFANSTVSSYNYCVDNEGTLSYLFIYLRSKEEKSHTNGNVTYYHKDYAHGIGINKANATQNKIVDIPSKGITTIDPKLEIINDKLICTGQYYEGEHMYRADGTNKNVGFFLLTIDQLKAELKTKSFDFLKEDIKTKLTYKDKGKKYFYAGSKEYLNYKTVWLNNCFYQIQLRAVDDGYVGAYGKEIIIYKYDVNHKLQWMKLIPRSTFDDLNGVNYLISKKINLFYYESPENLITFPKMEEYDPEKYKTVKSTKKGVLLCTSIDEAGNVTREKVATNGENPVLDKHNYNSNYVKELNAIIAPVNISSSQRRYDLISLED